ncbi:MAG: N-acetylneuraminate synthase family protein [Candidatus Pacebacteria bacterium]|nr:N-acetylneuraminate synthase family protein [Candidatus Paceibacterota bacterium]
MENKVFIIAEAGINHNGEIGLAKKMIDAAKESGADCIKFQTFRARDFISDPDLMHTYKSQGKEVTESQLKMFARYEFNEDNWKEIINYCKGKNIVFATTPQNPSDLDLILSLTNLNFIKVGSDDLTNLELMEYYAKKNRPMIISAGMAYDSEIGDAVNAIRNAGNNDITVMHCVSSYPAQAEEINLKKIQSIKDQFKVKVGFSDHSIGSVAAVGAVCLGASVIEKHFTLSHDLPGPDHWFSLETGELKKYVDDIRFAEKAVGSAELIPTKAEMEMRKIARRSIVAKADINSGDLFTDDNIEFKRPGTGLAPKFKKDIINKAADRNYKKGDLIQKNGQ